MKNSVFTGKKILVVDDETYLREAIAFDLKRKGAEVFEAGDGEQALAIVENVVLDSVISDVRMPHMNGIQLLEKIREKNPKIPFVVLVTGFADLSEPEPLQKGANALLDKPIDRKKMFELLEKILAQSA